MEEKPKKQYKYIDLSDDQSVEIGKDPEEKIEAGSIITDLALKFYSFGVVGLCTFVSLVSTIVFFAIGITNAGYAMAGLTALLIVGLLLIAANIFPSDVAKHLPGIIKALGSLLNPFKKE